MAATALTFARMGVMTRDAYGDHFDKSMDSFLERYETVPLQGGQFFSEEDATTLTHKVTTYGNTLEIPHKSNDTDPLPMDQAAPGYDKTINLYTYRMGTRITRTMAKIDLSGKIMSMAMDGLPKAGQRLLEYAMADIINNGTSTAGSDGSNLFATDHYLENSQAGTWSNYETAAALTSTTFNTMKVNMRKRTGERGDVSPIALRKLVVPADLEEKAYEIQGSDRKPENALNNINVHKGKFDVVVWDYLTDTNGWGGWGDLPEAMWGLHIAYLTRPEVRNLGYPIATEPDIIKGWELYVQFGVAGSQLKNMHWNIGA